MFEKGKSGNPKGRPKGATNKDNRNLKDFVGYLLNSKREKLEKDFDSLKPYERLKMFDRLLGYVLPRLQPTSPESVVELEYKQLQNLLVTLPDEAINKIAAKVLEMQKMKQDGQQNISSKSD